MTEQEYYDQVKAILVEAGFNQDPDRDLVVSDKEDGFTPGESAEEFISDWR